MIFYVLLIISYTFAEDIASTSTENKAVALENDAVGQSLAVAQSEATGENEVTGQSFSEAQSIAAAHSTATEESAVAQSAAIGESVVTGQAIAEGHSELSGQNDAEEAIPVAGSVNFAGHAKASGKVTIVGTTEPNHFDNPWGLPISVGGLLPDDDDEIIYIEYPGPLYPNLDNGHGIPPYLLPRIGSPYNSPYSPPLFPPTPTMSHPHFIEIIEPTISPSFMQPQLIEIIEPPMGGGLMEPQFIEIIDPLGSQSMFDPFYPGLNLGMQHQSYPYFPHDLEMVPVIVEFDVMDNGSPSYNARERRAPIKRETEYVPVSGKVTIVGQF